MTIILPCYTWRASLPVASDPVLVANLKHRGAKDFTVFSYLNLLWFPTFQISFCEYSVHCPVGKVASRDCLSCKQKCDVRTVQFSTFADFWLVKYNFRGTGCMQGCEEYRKIKVHVSAEIIQVKLGKINVILDFRSNVIKNTICN